MKRVLAFLLAMGMMVPGIAQTDAAQAADDVGARRQEIEVARQRETARFDAADAQCRSRFAVNDCLRVSQTQRRSVMADLRKQEVRLNEQERAQRGAEQVELTKKKLLERNQQDKDLEAAHAANLEARAQKEKDLADKREANRNVPASHPAVASSAPHSPAGPVPAERAANRAEFERRQAQAQQRREDVQRRQSEKTGAPASSLPVPP